LILNKILPAFPGEESTGTIIAQSGLYVKITDHQIWSMVSMFVGYELCLLRIERLRKLGK